MIDHKLKEYSERIEQIFVERLWKLQADKGDTEDKTHINIELSVQEERKSKIKTTSLDEIKQAEERKCNIKTFIIQESEIKYH